MFFDRLKNVPYQSVDVPFLRARHIELIIKREDVLHPFVSGNKFRKLKYNILQARETAQKTLLTFGGAYSNHIAATATAAKMTGFSSVGIIRGEELARDFTKTLSGNPTFRFCVKQGMKLHFVTREQYREKNTAYFLNNLLEKYPDAYVIPEGGTNDFAVKGCAEIVTADDVRFDFITVAVGTGGTFSGLVNSASAHQTVIGFSVVRDDSLPEKINGFCTLQPPHQINTDYHFGGYAKVTASLINFINHFKKQTGILLDPIYTGKMMFGLYDLIQKDFFPAHSRILAIHTGGIQGIEGMNIRLKKRGLPTIEK